LRDDLNKFISPFWFIPKIKPKNILLTKFGINKK
jgi:hypothetical protein